MLLLQRLFCAARRLAFAWRDDDLVPPAALWGKLACQLITRFRVCGTTGGAAAFFSLFLAARVRFNSLLEGGLAGRGILNRSMTGLVL